jgi:hypothetical protein
MGEQEREEQEQERKGFLGLSTVHMPLLTFCQRLQYEIQMAELRPGGDYSLMTDIFDGNGKLNGKW